MSYVPHEDQKMSDKELEQHRERFHESLEICDELCAHANKYLDSHRQQLVKEIREALEGMRKSKTLSHACLKSWGGCDCKKDYVKIDDILALPELREE